MENSASRLVEYRTRTCLWSSLRLGEARRRRVRKQDARRPEPLAEDEQHAVDTLRSQFDLGRDLEKARRQDRQRLQPRPTRDECVVVRQHRARVQQVVDVERDAASVSGRTSDVFATRKSSWLMRSPYIEPGATRFTVTLGAFPERFLPERRRHDRVRHRVVRRQHRAGLALKRRRDLDVDLRDHVGRRGPGPA